MPQRTSGQQEATRGDKRPHGRRRSLYSYRTVRYLKALVGGPQAVRFPWKFPESCFLSRGQISKRISRKLYQGQLVRARPRRRISSTRPSLSTPMPTISNLRVVSKVNFTYESKNSTRSKNRTTFYPHPNRSNRSVASESPRHAHERINSGWSPRRHGAQHQRDLAACDFPDRLTHPAACPATGSSSTLGPL